MAEQTPTETAELMEVAEATNAAIKMNIPAQLSNMQMQNLTVHQQAMQAEQLANTQALNQVRLIAVSEFVRRNSAQSDLEEAVASQKLATTSDSSQAMSATFIAALAQILQQGVPSVTPKVAA
jgi:hypothetical protein